MVTRRASVGAAVSGLVGTGMLIISFAINNGPAADATAARMTAYEQAHRGGILWGSWLQAVGPVFIVAFALTIVVAAGATRRVSGWMTLFGTLTLMTVSLVEIVFYVGAQQTAPDTMAQISTMFVHSVQHLYLIVAAPAVFAPLGLVILGSDVLPRVLGRLALVLAAGYALAGVFTVDDLTVPVPVQISASVQVLWWLAAGACFIVRARRMPSAHEGVAGAAVLANSA